MCAPQVRLERVIAQLRGVVDIAFTVDVVDNVRGDPLNAEAIPEDRVHITSKLLEELTDDGLAFILAHEVAHLDLAHRRTKEDFIEEYIEQLTETMSESNERLKGKGAGRFRRVLSGSVQTAAGLGLGMLGLLAASRIHEGEADERAVETAFEAGFDPVKGAGEFLTTAARRSSADGLIDVLLRTHPEARNRIERVRDHVRTLELE